jgi:hypothetical protein
MHRLAILWSIDVGSFSGKSRAFYAKSLAFFSINTGQTNWSSFSSLKKKPAFSENVRLFFSKNSGLEKT